MTVQVRPATPADAPAISRLQNAIIALGGTTAHQHMRDAATVAEAYINGTDCLCCHVALGPEDTLLGFQAVGRHPDLPPGWGDIGSYVSPDLQGGGIGAALFHATKQACRDLGLTALNATIRADNHPGLAYYARIGFVDYGNEPEYCLADGTRVGRVHRRLEL